MRALAAILFVPVGIACGAGVKAAGGEGARPSLDAAQPTAEFADAQGASSVVSRVDAGAGAIDASAPGVWRVSIRSDRRSAPTVATWPTLEHQWQKGAPYELLAETSLCLPKGAYVFDLSAAPTWHSDITVDGEAVIRQRDFPTELSKAIEFGDACRTVRVQLVNPLAWTQLGLSLVVRPAAVAAVCDTNAFPTNAWNVCLFHGRNEEEPIGTTRSETLAVPPNQAPGRHDSFDWYSLVARKTVCFARATYILHADADETLKVRIGESLVLDAAAQERVHAKESSPLSLEGCKQVMVSHTYRYAHSRLNFAWARVGSPEERGWAADRACGFRCDAESKCTPAKALASPFVSEATCVPTARKGSHGEYCDEKHRCGPQAPFCVRNRCYED